jgi:hypothetical protein
MVTNDNLSIIIEYEQRFEECIEDITTFNFEKSVTIKDLGKEIEQTRSER